MFSEIHLTRAQAAGPSQPGHGGKLWLYLPGGQHAPKSLPCVLIAGAGSNLITGMDLGDGDRPEHLPHVRAGFAVLAYELDGALPENANQDMQAFARSSAAFLNAQAGLINARVAIEYATTQVPSIDPKRLYAVGHSSAATLALLVAENEPRIAACAAFAPAVDIRAHSPPPAQSAIAQLVPGADQFFTRFNPGANESKINCPLFLFYADDDARFASQVRELGVRLQTAGKKVTVASVASGGHYDSMINEGVPRAIEWLKALQ
jgi:dienelactone hydrolase